MSFGGWLIIVMLCFLAACVLELTSAWLTSWLLLRRDARQGVSQNRPRPTR